MKQFYSKPLFTAVVFVCVFSFCNATAQSWTQLGAQGFSTGKAYYNSFTIAGGIQYVAYQDYSNGDRATVMSYNGSNWEVVGNPGFTPTAAAFTSIAVDKYGTPYVVYSDNSDAYQVSVMKYTGGTWVNVGPANFSNSNAAYTDIALDNTGTPYVVYADGSNYVKTTVKKYDAVTNSWQTVGGGGFSVGEARYTTIAISRDNEVYVAYQDQDSSFRAVVMEFNGTTWGAVGKYGFSVGEASTTDIAVDTNGTPYVVFSDNANGGKATAMTYTEAGWANMGSADFSDSLAQYTTIAVGKSGIPYVAYSDGGTAASGGQATVMEYNGTSWEPVCRTKVSAGTAWYTGVAVDSYSVPYVAYMDFTDSGRTSVLVDNSSAPCYPASVQNVMNANGLNIYPNPASTELTIAAPANIKSVVISNITGQTVYQNYPGTESAQIDISGLPAGMYFVKVNDTEVRKFVKE